MALLKNPKEAVAGWGLSVNDPREGGKVSIQSRVVVVSSVE